MADTTSTTQFRADISNLKASMQAAQRQVRLAATEFERAAAGLDDWSSSAEGLRAKVNQLNTTLQAQRRQVNDAREAWERTVRVYGENSAEADRAQMALNRYETQVARTERELNHYTEELNDCEQGTGRFAESTEDLEEATQRASDGFNVMKGVLADLVAEAIKIAVSALKDLAKETLEAGMNFEKGMAQVQAVSGATGEELEALNEKAKEMGETTKFSASESAEAFNYMAMAGWKTEEMLNGIEGVMNLAAASGEDLATTSDIVTDALTAMGYSAGDAGKLADVMAAASANANTNVGLMGKTFQYAAPIVGSLGYSMEDTAVAIGLMANAGIKGEKSGTALRSILTRLSAPPKQCAEAMEQLGLSLTDSAGNMKSLDTIMGELRKAFAGMTETQQTANAKAIAGAEAMSGLLAIVNAAPEDYNKLTKAVKDSEGAAKDMAETMNDTVEGQLTLLKSQIEGIQIQIYEELAPALKAGVKEIGAELKEVNWKELGADIGKLTVKAVEFFSKVLQNAEGVANVLKAVGSILLTTFAVNKAIAFATAIKGLYTTFVTLRTATEAATVAQTLLNAAQLATPIGIATAAVAGLAAGIMYLASKTKEYEEVEASLTETEKAHINKIHEAKEAYDSVAKSRDENVAGVKAEYDHLRELAEELDNMVDANGAVKESDEERANFIISTLNEALGTEMTLVNGMIEGYEQEKAAIEELMVTKRAEAVLRANEEAYNEAIKNRAESTHELTQAQKMYDENLSRFKTNQEAYRKAMSTTAEEYAKAHGLMGNLKDVAYKLEQEQEALRKKYMESGLALSKTETALEEAQVTYTGYMSTIKNYEGVASAVITKDSDKITESLGKLENGFLTHENATKEMLENQVKAYKENLDDIDYQIKKHTPGFTEEMRKSAQKMVKAAEEELTLLPAGAEKSTVKAGKQAAKGLDSTKGDSKKAAGNVKNYALAELDNNSGFTKAGSGSGSNYNAGILSQKSGAQSAGANLANAGIAGAKSVDSTSAGTQFANGMINALGSSRILAKMRAAAANFMNAGLKSAKDTAQINSPSRVTYQMGIYFVQGFVNAIGAQTEQLKKTASSMVTTVVKELASADWMMSDAGESASESFANAISKKLNYIYGKMAYENEQKLATFDTAIETYSKKQQSEQERLQNENDKKIEQIEDARDKKIKKIEKKREDTIEKIQKKINKLGDSKADKERKEKLEKELKNQNNSAQKKIDQTKATAEKQIAAQKQASEKLIKASEENYENLIKAEQEKQDAYSRASQAMISEYQKAMSEYQSKAQQLIDETIGGITDTYNDRYDELIGKQDNLINKLLYAGELFNVSGAGIMTINDLTEQTKSIREYTKSLTAIKDRVSKELFEEITSFDEKEGKAYLDRLLAMTDEELSAYNKAYEERLEAAREAADKVYGKDFDIAADDYQKAIKDAFQDLPSLLKEIGNECIEEFIAGMVENTDYMSEDIKTYINSMVTWFKKSINLQPESLGLPQIGNVTGTIQAGTTQKTSGTSVVNNYSLVQNNTSPKALTALETYQARRAQIAMIQAAT